MGAHAGRRDEHRPRVGAAGRRRRDARRRRAVADRACGPRRAPAMTGLEAGGPLARLTTSGTGGPARALARPRSVPELAAALRLARDEGLEVFVVGLGSNVLASDEGVHALVVRLEGELASVSVAEHMLEAGGGA